MEQQLLSGNEAIARGAYEAGVQVCAAYPGTPSTEILENTALYKDDIYSEWAPNEKVATEVAYGAAVAGARSLCAMKMVGLNVAADPFFTAAYMGVKGGYIVVTADDPSMHSSQNEQDNRYYARAAKVACIEPADSQECKDFVKYACEISEKFDMPVLFRTTTRISHSKSLVTFGEREEHEITPYARDIKKYVCAPANAYQDPPKVGRNLAELEKYGCDCPLNKVEMNGTKIGVISASVAYQYAKEAFPEDTSFLKLGLTWPLPMDLIRDFASKVDRLVIVDELDPFMEPEIKAAGIACEGKDLFTLQGEYSARMIRSVLSSEALPEKALDLDKLPKAPGRPPLLCAGCPHKGMFLALNRAKVQVMGDIGCYTLGTLPPTAAMDVSVCMGASVGMAHGFDKASDGEDSKKTVAVIGDSTFLHSGITNLINAVYNQSAITVMILDNSITGMTGHQQNPASGKNIRLQPAPAIDLETLCRSVGVTSVRTVDPVDTFEVEKIVKEEIAKDCVSVIIVRRPCALIPTGKKPKGVSIELNEDACKKCGACSRIMCPALVAGPDKKPVIDPEACNACGLCINMCKFDALSKKEEA